MSFVVSMRFCAWRMRKPMPALAAIISAATSRRSAVPAPSLRPAKIIGSAEGSRTFRMRLTRPAPKLAAARIRSGSAVRTPVWVLIAIGKKTPSMITATFDASPIPSQRIRSGSSAIFGIEKVAAISGLPTASATLQKPVTSPTETPPRAPSPKPRAMRRRLVATWVASSPDRAISTPASITPSGDGRKSAGIRPVRVRSSQSTRRATRAATRSAGWSRRSRARVRSGAGIRVLTCTGVREAGAHRGWPETGARRSPRLLERAPRLALDQRPDALHRRGELGLAQERLDARPVELDRHRRQHTPGPAREDDDAVREVHGLLDVVRDVEDRLSGPLPDEEQLLLHELARLRVERREGLVHQEHRRIHGEGARDPDTLAHAAGELVRVLRLEAGEPRERDVVARPRRALARPDTELLQPELDVRLHGPPREQRELLEDHRGRGLPGCQLALEADAARARPEEPRDDVEERRLAAARRAEERDELLGVHREAHVAEGLHRLAEPVAVRLRDPLDDDTHAAHAPSRRRKRWILPVAVLGSSATNSIVWGTL